MRSKPLIIYLEEEYKEDLKDLVKRKRYRSVSEYVRQLILRELEREGYL